MMTSKMENYLSEKMSPKTVTIIKRKNETQQNKKTVI
jgi:hypothetical protein